MEEQDYETLFLPASEQITSTVHESEKTVDMCNTKKEQTNKRILANKP